MTNSAHSTTVTQDLPAQAPDLSVMACAAVLMSNESLVHFE